MIRPPRPPITIHKIRSEIISKFNETYSIHIIKNFVKNRWGCSYKRGCPRPPKYAQSSIKTAKGLFYTELLRMIHREELIFNVDEWSFTRSLKSNYSWLPIGKSSSLINDVWREVQAYFLQSAQILSGLQLWIQEPWTLWYFQYLWSCWRKFWMRQK